ncbi:MAG TPA: hypothetical protein VJA47_01575, partial [archaeon]|nr:hypothetical protein [archaeon]
MGLFGKLFKKQPEIAEHKQPEKAELKSENLVDWIKSSNSEKIKSVLTELSGLWKELLDQTHSLQSSISVLEKAKFEPNDKMYAPINMIKDRFVTKSKLLNKIPKSIPENFASIKSTYSEASKHLSEFKEADIKQVHVVSVYFKKEAEQIIKTLKNVDHILSVFDKKLNSEGLVLEVVENIENKTQTIEQLKNQKEKSEKERSQLLKQQDGLDSLLLKQKTELEKINSDERWDKLNESREWIKKVDDEINKIKYSVKEEISSLKRPIKKVLHESEMKSDLPEDIEGLDVVCSTFNAADKILEKKSVELKGVELEKLNNFRNKINSGHFEEIKKSYQKLGSQKTELESAYNKLVNVELEKRAIEQKIKEIEIDIEKLKSEDQKL